MRPTRRRNAKSLRRHADPPLRRYTAILVLLTFTLTTLTDYGALAIAMSVGSSATASGSAAGQLGQIAESAGAVQSFQTDLFTGRAQTSVPIFAPPGRKNVQPNLSLNYSSSGGNGWLGAGWGLDLGFIQRDVKKGAPKYNSTDKYVFSYQGVNSELVSVGTNEYRAKDEALFLKFVYDSTNNKWTVTDKSGTQHTFGDSSGSRQANSLGTFKWALSKVKDTSGNYMTVSYTTDSGELYLSAMEYNGNETQSFAHTHKMELALEDRDDDSFSHLTGAKVETKKRLKEILVKVKDGQGTYQLARKYALAYEYSGVTKRSRLVSVTEYGKDGTTSLPAVTFSYYGSSNSLASASDYTGVDINVFSDAAFDHVNSSATGGEANSNTLDMNGDGYVDRILCDTNTSAVSWKIQYGGETGFGTVAGWGTVENSSVGTSSRCMQYSESVSNARRVVADLIDMNRDGLPDRVISSPSSTNWKVQYNNGSGFDASVNFGPIEDGGYGSNREFIRYTTSGDEVHNDLADLNGDGYPDRVISQGGSTNWKVQFHNGSGFDSAVSWGTIGNMPGSDAHYDHVRYSPPSSVGNETSVDLLDINGDGLPDRVQAVDLNTAWKVQFNHGSGFEAMADYGPVYIITNETHKRSYIRWTSDAGQTGADIMDLNGDGLLDRVLSKDENTSWQVQWNLGTGFSEKENLGTVYYNFGTTSHYSYPRFMYLRSTPYNSKTDVLDIDGDGMSDRVMSKDDTNYWKVQKNGNREVDLLKEIKNGRGGKTAITYTPSTRFDNKDTSNKQRLPFPVQVVSRVDQQDGMNNTYTTTYSYKGGMYDAAEREFRGFREVTVTDAVGTKTIHTFGQDDHNKGKLLTKEVKDSAGSLFSKETTTWSDTHPYTGVHFVFVSQQDNYVYDGDSSFKQTRQTFTYDAYGNLASTTEEGDVSITTDSRKTVNTFVYNTTDYILNTLSKTTLFDSDLTTVKAERYFYYDGATAITTAPVKGLLTKEEEWLSTATGCGTPGVCVNNPKTEMTYDAYGNVLTVKDARSYTTTNTYDTTYKLFLVTISNALSHTRSFTYDPWLAQILTSTDQNGQVTETVYDALGRVTKVIAPLDSSSEPTQEFAYDYPNLATCLTAGAGGTPLCVTKVTTKVKSSVPGQTFTQLITYSFTDGLGREIQRRSPAEDSTKQIVSGIVEFDSRGLVSKQYVPYFENTSTSYIVLSTSTPKATFTYDAVGRRTRIDYPDSTNSQVAFSDFVKTTTDQRGKQLRYTNDGYGRLVKVEEFNAGATYTTTYEYDVLNNLKKTTDNAGSITTVNYDSLSRKTGMTDPDMGTWSYTYDLNDNLTSQTDAKNQTISFTYDALNRVTLKDLPAGETDVTYNYDTAPATYSGQTGYWVGRLAKVIDASGTHEFKYDKQGRVLSDTKTVDSVAYAFERTYDSMGRVRTLTYPDTEVVTYAYNGFGDVETISGVKNSVTTDYIKEVSYNASGQITFTKYGNNVTSDYTYNANTLRLDRILTKKPDGTTKLQDLSYTFDNNGNVSQISDVVNSMSQTFTYDDLNRLISAVGSAYGTQTFSYDSIGNMLTKAGRTMAYGEGAPGPHAVTSVTGSSLPTFCNQYTGGPSSCTMNYDANGNMTLRGSDTLSYDSENRLKEMKAYEGSSATQNYTLKPGWNVVSFTWLPDNKSVSSVLSSLTFGTDYDQVSTWDSATSSWKHWVNDVDFNDFTQFEYGKTYEIYNNSGVDKSLTVTGKTRATDITHTIVSGDNFISPAVKTATNISTVLSSLTQGTHYSDVKRFNAATQTWESYASSQFTQFEPGKGYNIIGLTSASFSYGKTETTTTFVYDSAGARTKKSVTGGSTTIYLGKDYDITGSTSTKYIFLGDRRISMKESTGTLLFYHEDHISSSNVITDSSGNQAALLEYSPYGETVTHTGSANPKHKFTGQESDDSTRLYYYGARYMDPQLGRFITADPTIQHPTDPQDFNRYAYARNNPIRFNDPTGFGFWSKLFSILGAVVGSLIPGVGTVLGAIIGGSIGGMIDAAIAKQSLLRGALQGASQGLVTGSQQKGGSGPGTDPTGAKTGGDVGGMNAVFRPEETPRYVNVNGAALGSDVWGTIKGVVTQGLGLTRDVTVAVFRSVATWENVGYAMSQIVTPIPGAGGLNPDQQLSRFREDTESRQLDNEDTLYRYVNAKNVNTGSLRFRDQTGNLSVFRAMKGGATTGEIFKAFNAPQGSQIYALQVSQVIEAGFMVTDSLGTTVNPMLNAAHADISPAKSRSQGKKLESLAKLVAIATMLIFNKVSIEQKANAHV